MSAAGDGGSSYRTLDQARLLALAPHKELASITSAVSVKLGVEPIHHCYPGCTLFDTFAWCPNSLRSVDTQLCAETQFRYENPVGSPEPTFTIFEMSDAIALEAALKQLLTETDVP